MCHFLSGFLISVISHVSFSVRLSVQYKYNFKPELNVKTDEHNLKEKYFSSMSTYVFLNPLRIQIYG